MTLNDLVTRALRRFGVYSSSESISNDDYEFVAQAFTNAMDELIPLGLALWTLDHVPDRYAEAFTDYASPNFLPTFGIEVGDPDIVRTRAERRLRILTRDAYPLSSQGPDYF